MLIPARITPITDVHVYSEAPRFAAMSRAATISRTMMHVLLANTRKLASKRVAERSANLRSGTVGDLRGLRG